MAQGVGDTVEYIGRVLRGFTLCGFYPLNLTSRYGYLRTKKERKQQQQQNTTYFHFLGMSLLGIKSLARDTGPGATQWSRAIQSHDILHHHPPPDCDRPLSSFSPLRDDKEHPRALRLHKQAWCLAHFEWLISVSSRRLF